MISGKRWNYIWNVNDCFSAWDCRIEASSVSSKVEAINALARLGFILITWRPLMLNVGFWRAVIVVSHLSWRIKTLRYLHSCSYCSRTCAWSSLAGSSPTNYNYRSNSPDLGEGRAVLQWLILLTDYFHGFSPNLRVFILDCSLAMRCCINTKKTRFHPKILVFYKFPICLFSPFCLLSPTLLTRSLKKQDWIILGFQLKKKVMSPNAMQEDALEGQCQCSRDAEQIRRALSMFPDITSVQARGLAHLIILPMFY